MTGRGAEVTIVSSIALMLTVLIAVPVLRAPSDRIFGLEIVGRHHDPFTVMRQFDRPLAFGIYSQPLTDAAGALLARAAGPVAAYNWLVLLTFPLSAAAAYLLARHLALSPPSAGAAAIAFAFSPFHLAHAAYHPHVAQAQWLPLYLLALWRCLDDSTLAAIALLALSIVCVTLSNFYGGLIAAVITPVAVAAYWFFNGRSQPRSARRLAITVGGLVAVACVGVAYTAYAAPAVIADRAAFAFARDDLFRYSAKWWSYIVPPVANPLLGGIASRIWNAAGVREGLLEQQVTLGWGVIGLAGAALWAWLFRRRQSASLASTETTLAAVPMLAAVSAFALLCSLSPERRIGAITVVRPSALLYLVVPMFRAYARFGVIVQLMAVLLAGIGAERLWRSGRARARIACVTLLALAGGELAVWPPTLWRDVLPTMAHRWVVGQPGRVHALDCAPLTPESSSVQWLTTDRIAMRTGWVDDCMEPNLADKLSAAGYTHVIVRRDTSEREWLAGQHLAHGMRMAARFADADVFFVTAPPPVIYTDRLAAFYPREYDAEWTWRWMEPDASWNIVNSSDRPIVADVALEMTAFNGARRLTLRLDGSAVQTLTVGERRSTHRIGPLTLTSGSHQLVFQPADPPTVADDVMHNGDRRALSFGIGDWRWTIEGQRP